MSCDHCVQGLPPGEAFCPECGARADDAPPPGLDGGLDASLDPRFDAPPAARPAPRAPRAPAPAPRNGQASLWSADDNARGASGPASPLAGPAIYERPEGTRELPTDLEGYRRALREVFGYPDFRSGQADVLGRLARRNVLAVMPTGAGKSLCYVLPALEVGATVVVSPLIALMQDQVEALQAAGVAASFINSTLDRGEQQRRYDAFRRGELALLYVAPERFAVPRFAEGLREAGVALLAIDEAHCISEWGHNFRPDYLLLDAARRQLGNPRTLALTATADPTVRRDILERLGIRDGADEVVTTFDRPNLRFAVVPVTSDAERSEWLVRHVRAHQGRAGIVYARTRRAVEDTTAALQAAGVRAEGYHAGMASGTRSVVQRRFITGETPVIVATNAFGMGIDKPDVRFVVHLQMPGRIEAYYQEAGRAGRDGDPADCTLLYARRDRGLQARFIAQAHPDEDELRRIWERFTAIAQHSHRPPTYADLQGEIGGEGLAAALAVFRASGLVETDSLQLRSTDPRARFDLRASEARRRDAESRLAQMVEYAETSGCRRAVLLRYFGEQPAASCEGCDNCRGTSVAPSPDYPDELFEALIACRDRLARDSDRAPYMVFEDRTAREIATYRPADDEALLAVWGMGETRSRWFGEQLLTIVRDWEAAHPDATPPPSQAAEAARTLRSRRRGGAAEEAEVAFDDPTYQQLRAWRLERSRRDGVPAYTLFTDRTARELAARRPQDESALREIWGMGDARVAQFGAELLEVIRGGE